MKNKPHSAFAPDSPYRRLAASLDALPNRYPPADDESDLFLLEKTFTSSEADLAAILLPSIETPAEIAARTGRDLSQTASLLKEMSRKGLIALGKNPQGRLGFSLMPFVVGIYEAQINRIDAEMARLFETYYRRVYHTVLQVAPQVHRVVPVRESIDKNMEVHPYESVSVLLDQAQAWGVIDCICRTQKALIGDPCQHPLDVCLMLSDKAGAFDANSSVRSLTRDEAAQTLQRAARAGLVHCVSNTQQNLTYICSCCTCACAVLRGMAELGMANVVARSAFVNQVNDDLCIGCGECLSACQFDALSLSALVQVSEHRCVGCGVCISHCPQDALSLKRRHAEAAPPVDEKDWQAARMTR